jgi:hypothetical protein
MYVRMYVNCNMLVMRQQEKYEADQKALLEALTMQRST